MAADAGVRADARNSVDLILRLQAPSGAYPASPTFSAYRGYSWYRDGSFIAEATSRAGRGLAPGAAESADAFHDWAAGALLRRADHIAAILARAAAGEAVPDAEMLPTRFTLAGDDGSDPWWDFQLDGYGTWLWALATHVERHGRDAGRWLPAVELATDYLVTFWDRPCYDWWEEFHEERHVGTLGALYGGLAAVSRLAALDAGRRARAEATCAAIRSRVAGEGLSADGSHLMKWLGGPDAVDASLAAAVVPFGLADPASALGAGTIAAVRRDLEVDGGVHRYLDDVFYGGGQWPLLSCLVGWNLAAAGDAGGARALLDWALAQADGEGHLPEQVPGHLLHPEHRDGWIAKWGPVAQPLLWSHAMTVILADELGLLKGDN